MTVSTAAAAYFRVMAPVTKDPLRHVRVVDRLVSHGAAITFRELAERVVAPDTRYVVLDLDRTIHLGRNMGELLGWELEAYQSYGGSTLVALEEQRARRRFVLDWSRPGAIARYLGRGARRWAYPGLYYLLWGKVAHRVDWLRRRAFLRFGPDALRRVQRVPQLTLLRHFEEATADELHELAAQVWRRHRPDQVIDAEDIAWLRTRCPGVQIILASASPAPTVGHAADQLGVDAFTYSTLECINSGAAKIARLEELAPDLFAPGVVSVGITDTGYGEDHCWAEHFTKVVDVNSDDPFGAVVPHASRTEEVHSARLLTRAERARRHAGTRDFLDARRQVQRLLPQRDLGRGELTRLLGGVLDDVDDLLHRCGRFADPREAAYALARLLEGARAALDEPAFGALTATRG